MVKVVKVVKVHKSGKLEELHYEQFDESEIYKLMNCKNKVDVSSYGNWEMKDKKERLCNYRVYGKIDGKANHENKYEFPPPIDNILFYDSCIIVKMYKNKFKNLTIQEWEQIYEELFGGFEDIGEEDSEVSEDNDVDGLDRTQSGYVKDDFIVDDDEDYDDDFEDEDEDEDEDDEETCSKKNTDVSEQRVNTRYNTRQRNTNDTIFAALDDYSEE
jgi:hypothetical protein